MDPGTIGESIGKGQKIGSERFFSSFIFDIIMFSTCHKPTLKDSGHLVKQDCVSATKVITLRAWI